MERDLLAFLLLICLSACNSKTEINKSPNTGGISPTQALSTFRLREGFKIELVAAEPTISGPVGCMEKFPIFVFRTHLVKDAN
jgi:hypothetical protein